MLFLKLVIIMVQISKNLKSKKTPIKVSRGYTEDGAKRRTARARGLSGSERPQQVSEMAYGSPYSTHNTNSLVARASGVVRHHVCCNLMLLAACWLFCATPGEV